MIFFNEKKEFHTDKKLLIFLGIYLLSLFIVYFSVISHLYAYSQMTYTPNYSKLGMAIVFLLVTFTVIPRKKEKPSTYLFFILYTIMYMPLIMFYWMTDKPSSYVFFETICFVVLALLIKLNYKPIRIKAEKGKVIILIVLVIYILSCILLIIRNRGIHLSAIMEDLYQVRSENNISGIFGYILNWSAKSFMPFFFIYFFLKRNIKAVCLVSILQIGLFLSYGFKSFIMAVIMLFFVSILMRKSSSFSNYFLLSFSVINILSIFAFEAGSITLINLFPYRILFLPTQGQFAYYNFFTHNDFLHLSEGSIGRLLGIEYPYSQQIGRVVNIYIFGPQKLSNGNTGFLSYGFADFGFIGMLLATILISVVFSFIDSSTKDLPVIIPVSAMAYQMFTLNDNNILICLNTGGIMWSAIMLILLNSVYSLITPPNAIKKTHE